MKRMTLPAILAAAVLAFALAGCSQAQPMTEDTLKGIWKAENAGLGFDAYANFEDDSVAEVLIADSWLEGTWSVSGVSGEITFESAMLDEAQGTDAEKQADTQTTKQTAKLSYSNNKLTLGSPDGSKLVFVKDDSEEAKEMFSFELGQDGNIDLGNGAVDGTEYVDEVINPIEPVSIADDDKFTIKVTGKGTDFTGDPGYQISITNKTDKAVYVVPEDDFTVAGKKIEAGLGDELEAGETLETFMYFSKDDLGGDAEALTGADGVILVLNDENDEEIAKYTFHMEG